MASRLYPPTEAYTAEQWSRRIYQLQNTIYGPPHLTISTDDFHSRRSSSYAKYDDRIPQVVNTSAADDELSRSRRNSYATASGGPAREELYRGDHSSRRSTPLRSSVSIENIRPLYRSYYDGDARTPDAAVDYDDDSGYITGGPESSGRGGRSPYDGGTSVLSRNNGSRRDSGYNAPPTRADTHRVPASPLRGILRNPNTPSSSQIPYGDDADEHESRAHYGVRARGREPHSAVTPVIPSSTPYARHRHLSDAGHINEHSPRVISQHAEFSNRPPSTFDVPVIPQSSRSPHGSRPPSAYGPHSAPILESQERRLTDRRSASRPASVIDRHHFPYQGSPQAEHHVQSSSRLSTVGTPVSWNGLQLGDLPRNSPREGGRQLSQIRFYHREDPHYGFTNFSSHPVVYQGKEYPTSEHLFQSFKFHEYRPELAERIRIGSKYPSSALAEAHRLADEVRPDWFEVNIEKMYETLRLKFSQHEGLRAELLSTGDAILVEASDKDAFWGSGPNGQGRNELGKALMRLRDELRALTFADPHA